LARIVRMSQVQLFGQLALIVQRFLEQHPRVDEQDRRFRRDHR
jgi:hypothetical protein